MSTVGKLIYTMMVFSIAGSFNYLASGSKVLGGGKMRRSFWGRGLGQSGLQFLTYALEIIEGAVLVGSAGKL